MDKSNEIFELIKSMTMSEKRYFKIYASRHVMGEKNNYMRLFEAIEKMKVYNEKIIRKKFSNEKFIKQLSVAKNYLYHLILECLRNYNAYATGEARIKAMLNDLETLYSKGHYSHCKKIIERTKFLCYKYQRLLLLLEVLRWERTILILQGNIQEIEKNTDENYATLNKLNTIMDYQNLGNQMVFLCKTLGISRNKQMAKKYLNLISHPLLKHESLADTYEAKYSFFTIKILYKRHISDPNDSYLYSKKLINYMESDKVLLEEYAQKYLVALQNFSLALLDLRYFSELFETVKKMQTLLFNPNLQRHKSVLACIFHASYGCEISAFALQGQFEKGVLLIPKIQEGLKKYDQNLNATEKIVLFYHCGYIYLGAGQFKKALFWLNKSIDEPFQIRNDIKSAAYILSMIVHYELGNDDLLQYSIRSISRFLIKKGMLYQYEKILLNFIRTPLLVSDKEVLIKEFKKLKSQLLKLSKDTYEAPAFDYFDIIAWLTCKIENRSFAEIVREKTIK